MATHLTKDEDAFYDQFTTELSSVDGELKVTRAQRQAAIALCKQGDKKTALACMSALGATDFRGGLPKVDVPALGLHGEGDEAVPFAGSGQRTTRRWQLANCMSSPTRRTVQRQPRRGMEPGCSELPRTISRALKSLFGAAPNRCNTRITPSQGLDHGTATSYAR